MPSGYTAKLQDNPDMSFEEFVWRCSRAMGACIMQKDDPCDANMCMDEQVSNHHVKALQKDIEELKILRTADRIQLQKQFDEDIRTTTDRNKNGIQDSCRTREIYERMLDLVNLWEPPTKEHVGLKTFMKEQLTSSIEWDCNYTYYNEQLSSIGSLTLDGWIIKQIATAIQSIEYHTKMHKEEIERVNSRNSWKNILAKSVPYHKQSNS